MATGHQLVFPRLERLTLRHFTLFRNKAEITADLGEGVFCLVGANGLGKSTFLAAVNYALTGIAADPTRKFESVDEYYDHSLSYSANYFRGRISATDRPVAEIAIDFRVGTHRYSITRGMFEPRALRQLAIATADGGTVVDGNTFDSESARHEAYGKNLAADVGVNSFAQYVFLQLLVCTFDERRHLIFWDSAILEQALLLAFGIDPARAQSADSLRRKVDRFESQARNLQYQATVARRRLEQLDRETAGVPMLEADLLARYEELSRKRDEAKVDMARLRAVLIESNLGLASIRADIASVRAQYEAEFERRLQSFIDPRTNQLITSSLTSGRCGLCGSEGDQVREAIAAELRDEKCPLCRTPLREAPIEGDNADTLRELDERLESLTQDERATAVDLQQAQTEFEAAASSLEALHTELASFEAVDALVAAAGMAGGVGAVAEMRQQYAAEAEDATSRRDEFRRQRDEARAEYRAVQQELASAYAEAQTEFVPVFRDLAHSFLGLDVDIQLDLRENGVGLILSMQETRRREYGQLSESQRFFVDIALRMAIAQHMANTDHPATLFIDTPEGSLDIAYEARAGAMFASFVQRGFHLVMTANINTSQLLRRLAAMCGPSRMRLMRMTDWTDLSDVQIAEEELFNEAFSLIESALATGGASGKE